MSIKIEVHAMASDGVCSLSQKQGEVLTVTFADGTVTEAPLSLKSFVQLLRMKLGGKAKLAPRAEPATAAREAKPAAQPAEAKPVAAAAVPAGNGSAAK